MSDTPPDRLSLNARSPHFNAELLQRGVGIRFNGQEKTNVEEYCVSEGWIRVAAGRSLDRYGQPMTVKLKGNVEPYYEDVKADGGAAETAGGADPDGGTEQVGAEQGGSEQVGAEQDGSPPAD